MRDQLVDFVALHEGLKLTAYQDSGGVWTCGYGSTGSGVGPATQWTADQAKARLLADLAAFQFKVQALIHAPTSANQVDALTSFAYNVGIDAFGKSTLLKLVNAGQYTAAAEQFDKWNHVGGKVVAGLTARRAAEKALFLRK